VRKLVDRAMSGLQGLGGGEHYDRSSSGKPPLRLAP
jgi:hypothetical protein